MTTCTVVVAETSGSFEPSPLHPPRWLSRCVLRQHVTVTVMDLYDYRVWVGVQRDPWTAAVRCVWRHSAWWRQRHSAVARVQLSRDFRRLRSVKAYTHTQTRTHTAPSSDNATRNDAHYFACALYSKIRLSKQRRIFCHFATHHFGVRDGHTIHTQKLPPTHLMFSRN